MQCETQCCLRFSPPGGLASGKEQARIDDRIYCYDAPIQGNGNKKTHAHVRIGPSFPGPETLATPLSYQYEC